MEVLPDLEAGGREGRRGGSVLLFEGGEFTSRIAPRQISRISGRKIGGGGGSILKDGFFFVKNREAV